MNRTQRCADPATDPGGRPVPGPVTNMAGPACRAPLAGIPSFLAHPWRWHRRPCTGRVYAARVTLEVIVLLAMLAGLALMPWFRHEPALARSAIAAVTFGISAASAATMRRLGASGLRDRGRAAAGEASAVTQPGAAPSADRHAAGSRCRGFPAADATGHRAGHNDTPARRAS